MKASTTTATSDHDDDDFFLDPRPSISLQNETASTTGDDEAAAPSRKSCIRLNDVSRMSSYPNGTPVSRIFFPRCEADVLDILQAAHSAKKQVGIRGTRHSMGGHSIASQQGWEIDCKFLRSMQYEGDNNRVRCGPGCHWSDLIKLLNSHAKSPRTMQSYCSFSVGGTLAVNAHGITTDYCFAESVLEFRLARINTKGEAEVVVCRPGGSSSSAKLSRDLFSLALGGYGLFGVITEVLLKVEDNFQLELNTMQLKVRPLDDVYEEFQPSEFVRVYDNCRNSISSKKTSAIADSSGNCCSYEEEGGDYSGLGKIELKLARLNSVNLEKATFYVFRRSYSSSTVSELPVAPRELSNASQLLYKWAMPLLKDLRYAKEESTGKALDWSQDDGSSRNQLLFESAVPLSRLYNPLFVKDDTFVLQEFFCPHDKFSEWIEAAKPIYKDIESQQKKYEHELILLNTTIRYVEQDDMTFLNYSRVPGGVFAFVLYYRIHRNKATERRLGEFHNRLAEVTISMGGTFYLPYRRCYSQKLLKAAYPMIDKFAEMKELLDPDCVFSNLWFEHYLLPLCSPKYKKKWANMIDSQKVKVEPIDSFPLVQGGIDKKNIVKTQEEFLRQLPRQNQKDILRRKNSYRNLLRSKALRSEFRHQFLVQIFNLADPEELMRVMARAAWDPANNSDIRIYKYIYNHFHGSSTRTNSFDLPSLPRLWRGIQQLSQQKEELTRQTLSVVSKLGRLDEINNYVCMGDNGKTLKIFANKLNITGKLWLVHDKVYPGNTLPPIETVLERGSIDSVAHEEVEFDYVADVASEKLDKIPSESIDLVTINQGLHHIPIKKLFGFLSEVKRMLKPGGMFIIREHDLKIGTSDGKAAYPMLDLAHSVFNVVTGVTVKEETKEIRAFRSILEWRGILESVGFIDSLVYEIEDGDPTWDEMLCFLKLPSEGELADLHAPSPIENGVFASEFDPRLQKEKIEPPIIGLIHTLLSQVPAFAASNTSTVLQYLSRCLPNIENKLTDLILVTIPYLITQNEIFGSQSREIGKQVYAVFEPVLNGFFRQALGFVDGSIALLSDSELQPLFNFKNLVQTTEVYLLMPYLQRKVQLAPDDASAIEKKIISFIEDFLPTLLPEQHSKHDNNVTSPPDNRDSSEHNNHGQEDNDVVASEVQLFILGLAEILPSILDTESVMLQSEFSLPQQASLVGQFGGHDLPSACANLAGYLDRKTWNELKTKMTTAASSGDLPTKSRLLHTSSEIHPWHLALKTFFMSPKVRLNEKSIFAIRLLGLGAVGKVYTEAKKDYEAERTQPSFHSQYTDDVTSKLKSFDGSINELDKEWSYDIVQKTITYSTNSSNENCLWDVAEIIEAKFGYKSITSRKVDVTKELRDIHACVHTKLANPEFVNSEFKFKVPDNVQIGWLPIYEGLLVEMRNKGRAKIEVGDRLRKGLVKGATLGTAGNNQLKIKYRRLRHRSVPASKGNIPNRQSALYSGHFESLKSLCKDLCTFLESNDIVRADLHPNDGAYTWFKLNEWMQVEILDELVKSLEQTPWYRFPFLQFMNTYFEVFQRQCSIVQEKYGLIQAYGSMPFLVDLVPGIVMTVLFAQMKLFAIPLQVAFPNGYDEDKSRLLEDIVVHLPLNLEGVTDWDDYLKSTLDERILQCQPLPYNFIVLSLPTFKTMGEILKKIAIRFPSARVYQISNQCEVQVRVSVSKSGKSTATEKENDADSDLQRILSAAGVELKTSYKYPNTNNGHVQTSQSTSSAAAAAAGPSKTYYCLEVHCLALLEVFRICNSLSNHRVEQVYDFWN